MKCPSYPVYFFSFILLVLVMLTSGCSQPEERAAVSGEESGEVISQTPVVSTEVSQRSAGDTHIIMLPGNVPLEMVWIPPGSFMMGSPDDEQDRDDDESPQHKVTFAKGFWMGKYPITQAQWQAVMEKNPAYFKGLNKPVESVSWNDIRMTRYFGLRPGFLGKLNATCTGYNFRLPSEAEWEYAYRAGTTTRFYWGDDPEYTEIDDYAWYEDNSDEKTHDVGLKQPNAWGLYDMAGNVDEWCEDDWHDDYHGAPSDGSAWLRSLRLGSRMIRGGSWYYYPEECRAAFRYSVYPGTRYDDTGFRVVCTTD